MEHASEFLYNNFRENNRDKVDTRILEVQKTLNKLNIKDGYGNKIIEDGIIGVGTSSGIRRLQCILNLEMNERTVSDIISTINYIVSKPVLSVSYESNIAVRYIQWRLGITVDGVYGNVTKAAVERFQSINNIEPTGMVGVETWSKLIDWIDSPGLLPGFILKTYIIISN